METIHYLLATIRQAPHMYLGVKSLSRLRYFVDGAVCALYVKTGKYVEYAPGFSEFIQEKYRCGGSEGTMDIMIRHCADEAEAFDTFFELLDEFMAQEGLTLSMPKDMKEDVLGVFIANGQPCKFESLDP